MSYPPKYTNESTKIPALPVRKCEKCSGAGWVWGIELDDSSDDTIRDTMTRYTCDRCNGTGNDGEWEQPNATGQARREKPKA